MWEVLTHKHNLIPPLGFENYLISAAGLTLDQVRFAIAFFSFLYLGPAIRLITNPTARKIYALVTGFAMVYYPFGSGSFHALPPAILTYLCMILVPRKSGTLSWLVCFPYLIMLHVANASGTAWNKGELDFTGGLMVLVLKLIATAMSYQDYQNKNQRCEMSSYQKDKHLTAVPGVLEYLAYCFCLGNLLGGPFIEYKDYQEWINNRGLWDPRAPRRAPSGLRPAVAAFLTAITCMAIHLGGSAYASTDLLFSPWYAAAGLPARLAACIAVGFIYRNKYYFAWKLAEAGFALAGLDFAGWEEAGAAGGKGGKGGDGGAEGKGAENGGTGKAVAKPRWGRTSNARVLEVELADSARQLPGAWNTGTGIFLRRYVYERLMPAGRKPTFATLFWTQLVSGIWHGLFPGYILFFASSAVMFHFSTVLYKTEQKVLPLAVQRCWPWRAAKTFITSATLNYLATAFLLLSLKPCLEVWASVHYVPHIWMAAVIVLGPMLPGGKRRVKADSDAHNSGSSGNGEAAAAPPKKEL